MTKAVIIELKEKYKILIMFILLAISFFLTYYFHAILRTGIVFTHFFYIPIILATLWWKRKGLIIVIFLAALLVLSDVFLTNMVPSYDDIPRIFMFMVIGFIVAVLSETVVKSNELVGERTSELRESETKYRTLYESSSDAIMLLDEKGFFDCNNATLAMFGFLKKEDYIKVHPADISPPYQPDGADSLTAANNKISEAFRKGKNSFEWLHRRKNGEDFPAEVLLTAFQLKGKHVLQATVRDITERKRAENELIKYREHLEELVKERTAELQKEIDERKRVEEDLKKHRDYLEELVNERTREVRLAKEEAERANMAKTNFLHTMSHELRTPLNAVLGFSEMLKQRTFGELNEKQEHFIDNIITGGNNLHNIISQILDVVKMDEGTLELHIEKIPVPEIVDAAIGAIKECAAKKNVLIEKNIDTELEYIEADKLKFKQVFINILENAVKFSKQEGGKITITTRKEGDMAKFSVSDTGIGIREDDVGKLFQKFTQLDIGTTRKYGGTGIGLAISKQFVELHGGKIWADSNYGEGSTFTFLIPLKDSHH